MSKNISETSNYNQKRIIKTNNINNLPKVEKKIINQTNKEIITTKKNKKIIISEGTSNKIESSPKINSKYIIANQGSSSPKYYKITTHIPHTNYQIMEAKEFNDNSLININTINKNNLLKNFNNENDNDTVFINNNTIDNNIDNNRNNNNGGNDIIYNKNTYNNNDFYESKSIYQFLQKTDKKKINNNYSQDSVEYNSCSYDVKRTKKVIKYNYNSPKRQSKILVKSILCSPINVSYTKIDNPLIEQSYNEYKEEVEETEIVIKNKMRKIWGNESECVTECSLSFIKEENRDKKYIIEEYEEKIKELNNTIYTLRKTSNIFEQEIKQLKSNLNNKNIYNMKLESFNFNLINKKPKIIKLSWNEINKKENVNYVNIIGKKGIKKPLLIQKTGKLTFNGIKKPKNIIYFGDYIEILSTTNLKRPKDKLSFEYGDELFIPGKQKAKNIVDKIKGFNIFKKPKIKIKNIIQHSNDIIINSEEKRILKQKPKNNNIIIENINNIFIPPKKKELFTWDTFYGQELYILSKKKKKVLEIEYLDDLQILNPSKPPNQIEFNDFISIMPEPKAPFEIEFTEELYISETPKKLKAPKKPFNKIVNRDKIKLLGKKIGKNIIQKVSLVEIYAYLKPKIIEYEENDYLFIPGNTKPENIIEFGDYLEILAGKIEPKELVCEPCDYLNILALDKPNNELQNAGSFDILRTPKPENIIEENDYLFILSSPKKLIFEIEFGDEIILESFSKPKNTIQKLKGYNILKKPKPLNIIQKSENIEIISLFKPLNIIYQEGDSFTIKSIEKPKNKIQRVSELKLIKKIKKYINKPQKSTTLYIMSQPRQKTFIQKTNDINLSGMIKENILEIEFNDEMFIEEMEKPINKIQRAEEIKIYKKPKIKNIKQKASELQILKKVKPKNKIQKCENINLYSKPKNKNNNNNIEIYFGDEILLESLIKPTNKMKRLNSFNLLKKQKQKPINKIQVRDEIELLSKPIQNLIYEQNELFTIWPIEKAKNIPQRINEYEIIKKVKKPKIIYKKLENFFIKPTVTHHKEENIIADTANFQIISVSIRELYQQRLQGFTIYKKEKELYEIENNYNFIIMRDYDPLLNRNNWDYLYIQKEDFSFLPTHNEIKLRNENQDDFLIEANSQISEYKENINDTITNSKEFTGEYCRFCGGKKRISEHNSNYECNIIKTKNENNNYRYENKNNLNVVKSSTYKTLLAVPKNEIDYINNIEISVENKNDNILLSDDEYTRGRKINNNINKYDNKSYNIKNKTIKILDYNNNINKINNNNGNININNSELCNYNQNSENIILKNQNNNVIKTSRYRVNNMLWKKNYNKDNNIINNNNNNYNNNYSNKTSRYTLYRNYSNANETTEQIKHYQSKSQIKSIPINKNRKRKLFRFEEGKEIKVIYQ